LVYLRKIIDIMVTLYLYRKLDIKYTLETMFSVEYSNTGGLTAIISVTFVQRNRPS